MPDIGAQFTADDFNGWRTNPVTEWVMRAFFNLAEAQRRQWEQTSFLDGRCDEKLLIELRTRADAYVAMQETEYEAFCRVIGEEPRT